MKIDKKTLIPIVVLVSICVIVAALLGAVNMLTAPEIREREEEKSNAALLVVLPDAKSFEKIELTDKYPAEITKAYKADVGYVFETYVKGKDFMTVMCGIDNDGKVVGVDVITDSETPDYKNKVFPVVTGTEGKYTGKNSGNISPELVSGATLTSNGIYSAVKASLDGYTVYNGGTVEKEETVENPFAREDSEILSLAAELVPDAKDIEKVELDGEYENLVGLYKDNGGLGYVAYVLVISPNYGTPETEALLHITEKGEVKAIKTLTWKTSPAIYGYVPPTPEEVNRFYSDLKGRDFYSLHDVEPASNATNTSDRVIASFNEAIYTVNELEESPLPRILGIVIAVGAIGAFVALLIFSKKRRAPYEK